jgi:hypothetical protein
VVDGDARHPEGQGEGEERQRDLEWLRLKFLSILTNFRQKIAILTTFPQKMSNFTTFLSKMGICYNQCYDYF